MFLILPLGFVFSRKPRIANLERELRNRRERIRCPVCSWTPSKADAWCCAPDGCWHVWNTFDTRALCPGCSKQWEYTECLSCHTPSRHEDWYEVEEDD